MRTSLLLLGLAATIAGRAQWTSDILLNTPVRAGNGVEAATPLMTHGPAGSTYISWFDGQPGGYEMRMQRLDVNGYPLWPTQGLVVSTHPQNSALFRYDLRTDNDGNAILAFQDERSGHLDVVVYKVDPAGNLLWGADGIALTDPASQQGLAPVIGVLNNNDVIVAWSANDGGSDKWVPFQWIDAAGTVQWTVPQQVNGTANYSRPKVVQTLSGGYIIQYVEETGSFPFTSNLYAQRFDATGSALWASPVHVSTRTISAFHFPEPISDGHNGMYLAFNTGNPGNAALTDVYLQRVRGDGGLWSTDGTELLQGTTTQRFGQFAVLVNDIMGVMVPMQVTNTGQTAGALHIQSIDTAGNPFLGPNGALLIAQSTALPNPIGAANLTDGCLLAYEEVLFGAQSLKAMRVGIAGNPVWPGQSVTLSGVPSNKLHPSCSRYVNDQLVAVWEDDRSASGTYAQNIDLDGNIGLVTGTPPKADAPDAGIRVLRTGDDGTDVLLHGLAAGGGAIEVHDALGRLLSGQRLTLDGQDRQVHLPPTGSGLSVVTVRAGGRAISTRFVVP